MKTNATGDTQHHQHHDRPRHEQDFGIICDFMNTHKQNDSKCFHCSLFLIFIFICVYYCDFRRTKCMEWILYVHLLYFIFEHMKEKAHTVKQKRKHTGAVLVICVRQQDASCEMVTYLYFHISIFPIRSIQPYSFQFNFLFYQGCTFVLYSP